MACALTGANKNDAVALIETTRAALDRGVNVSGTK